MRSPILQRLAGERRGSPAQLRLIEAMDLDPTVTRKARPVGETLKRASAWSHARAGLLSPAECAYLQDKGTPELAALRGRSIRPPGNNVPHPVRTSDGMMFGVYDEDLVVNAINRRIAAFSGTGLDQGEPLQMLRYGIGDEYRAPYGRARARAEPAHPDRARLSLGRL